MLVYPPFCLLNDKLFSRETSENKKTEQALILWQKFSTFIFVTCPLHLYTSFRLLRSLEQKK